MSIYGARSRRAMRTVETAVLWFGGMDVAEAQRLKALEGENRRLKTLVRSYQFAGFLGF